MGYKELPPMPPIRGENFVNVSEPQSEISLAPSIITEVETREDFEQITEGALSATCIPTTIKVSTIKFRMDEETKK